jgi:hypothetical protein
LQGGRISHPVGPRAFCCIRNRTYQALGPNPDDLFMENKSDVDPDPYGSPMFCVGWIRNGIEFRVGKNEEMFRTYCFEILDTDTVT